MRAGQRGVTLIELLVAVAVLTVGVIGFFGAFQFITKAVHVSRTRTLATNLAQERVEALKNISYYQLLITTAPAVDGAFSPPVSYDTANYPPETISIGGIRFTRYTFVALAQIDNNIVSTVTYTYPDTGMKQITSHIVWEELGVKKKWTLQNLLENPNINPLDASFSGTITRQGGAALPGARVYVEQNPDWNDLSDATGDYDFRVYHGSYTIRASSAGYYDAISTLQQAVAGTNTDVDLTLIPIATGTVTGIAWYLPYKLLLTGVVADSNTVCGDGASHDVEYIELYNATTAQIAMGPTGTNYWDRRYSFWYYDEGYTNPSYDYAIAGPQYFNFVFVSTYVPAYSYFLIANCTYFTMNGVNVTADAYYGTLYEDRIKNNRAGSVAIYDYQTSSWVDYVGWMRGAGTYPPMYKGTPVPDVGSAQTFGTPIGNQIVRVSSPGASMADIDAYARAYETEDNSKNWIYPFPGGGIWGVNATPRGVTSGTFPIVTGRPAVGAGISASDPYSGSTTAYAAYITSGALSLPYARFALAGISTGTWTIEVGLAFGTSYFYQQVSTVAVYQGTSTWIPNATTDPAWVSPSLNGLALTGFTFNGFVKGKVTAIGGAPLSGIQIVAGGINKTTGSNGDYYTSVATGPVLIVANPNNANPAYVQQIAQPTVGMGQVITQNFTLSLGGALQGFVTSATSPLPNIVVTANISGSQYGSGTSGTSGNFLIRNLSTGTYTVQPVLDPGMTSTPVSISATVSSTDTIVVGTFTVIGAFGNIVGTITDSVNSSLVTSGALVLASTAAISSTPPLIAGSSAPAMTPLYAVSSKADGTYILPVRGGSTYNVSVYVPVVAPNGSVSVTTKTYSGVAVTPSVNTTHNVSIP